MSESARDKELLSLVRSALILLDNDYPAGSSIVMIAEKIRELKRLDPSPKSLVQRLHVVTVARICKIGVKKGFAQNVPIGFKFVLKGILKTSGKSGKSGKTTGKSVRFELP